MGDEEALWKSYPHTVESRLMVTQTDSPENPHEHSRMSTCPLTKKLN